VLGKLVFVGRALNFAMKEREGSYIPCFTVNRISVEFKAEHFDMLDDAVRDLGFVPERGSDSVSFFANYGRVTVRDGKVTADQRDKHLINKLRQSYSKQIIKTASRRYGWALKEVKPNQFIASKR